MTKKTAVPKKIKDLFNQYVGKTVTPDASADPTLLEISRKAEENNINLRFYGDIPGVFFGDLRPERVNVVLKRDGNGQTKIQKLEMF